MLAAKKSTLSDRLTFEKTKSEIEFPDLLGVQIEAFQSFIQENVPEDERENLGLQEVFTNVFPLEDPHRNYVFEYKSYFLGLAKYTPEECMDRGLTYSVPLKVRLVLHITNEDDRSKYDQSIEQEVYFGNIPMMTKKGTFVINGAERVIVSQLQRSPGVFFDQSIHPNGTKLYQGRIIPFRGSWVDFTTDINDCIFCIIDRRRKFPVTMLLRTLGYSTNADIFKAFNCTQELKINSKDIDSAIGSTVVEDIIDHQTGEIFMEGGSELDEKGIDDLKKAKIKSIEIVNPNKDFHSMMLLNTMTKDPSKNTEEALNIVYQLLRSGEPPNLETAQKFIERIFFNPKKYDLGEVGRYRLNQQLSLIHI